MEPSRAFTTVFSGRTSILFNKVVISTLAETGEEIRVFPTLALWDTGANGSCITPAVVKALGIKAYKKRLVLTGAGEVYQDVYLICLHLPNEVAINLEATEIPALSGDMEALVGMNIIGLGDFAVSNFEGSTQMTFRIPSVEHADYT